MGMHCVNRSVDFGISLEVRGYGHFAEGDLHQGFACVGDGEFLI